MSERIAWLLATVLLGLLGALPARAASTTVNSFFDGSEPEMPQRLFRDKSKSTCDSAPFPGTFDCR